MAGVELPAEAAAFLLVGRIVEKGHGYNKKRGVVKYCWSTFGSGKQHVGLPVFYPAHGDGPPTVRMDTDFRYHVFWEGCEEPEEHDLEQVHAIATNDYTDEPWLPDCIRKLQQDGWDQGREWQQLTGDNVVQYLQKVRTESAKAATKAAAKATAKRPAGKAQGPTSKKQKSGVAKKADPGRGKEPLVKPAADLGDRLQAVWGPRKRKEQAEGEPAPMSGNVGEPSAAPAPAAKKKKATKPTRVVPAAPTASVPAAAAAAVVPSGGQGSPAEAGKGLDEACSNGGVLAARGGAKSGAQRQQQQQMQQRQKQMESESCVAAPSSKQRQASNSKAAAGEAGTNKAAAATVGTGGSSKAKAATGQPGNNNKVKAVADASLAGATKGKAPSSSKGKQALSSPTRSTHTSSSGRAGTLPAVLRQHEQEPLAPIDSARLAREDWEDDCAPVTDDVHGARAFWFDRVKGSDGAIYRVWSQTIIVPEAACFKPKADKRLRTWKVEPQNDGDYTVDAILAEREDEDGQLQYLVKWRGYEVDPNPEDGWVPVHDTGSCRDVVRAWKRKGRQAWLDACRSLLTEAGRA